MTFSIIVFFDESIARLLWEWATYFKHIKLGYSLSILSVPRIVGIGLYTTNLRTKEIGVRKVLGASVARLLNCFLLTGVAGYPVHLYWSRR